MEPQLESESSDWELVGGGRPPCSRFSAKLYRLQEESRIQRLSKQSTDSASTFAMKGSSPKCAVDESDEMVRVQHNPQSGAVSDARSRIDARSLGSSLSVSSDFGCGSSDSGFDTFSSEMELEKPEMQKKKKILSETADDKKRRRVGIFLDKLSPDNYAEKSSQSILQSIPLLDGADMVDFTARRIMYKVREDMEHTTLWADLCAKLAALEAEPTGASVMSGKFRATLLGHVKAQFGDGTRPPVPETADEDPRAVLRAEERAREMYLSSMHFLALLFCHELLPENRIYLCIKTLMPSSGTFWQQYYDDDRVEAVCILVKICVPFMELQCKEKTRYLVDRAFTNVSNSVTRTGWLRACVRDANYAWDEVKNLAILRVVPDYVDYMELPPPSPARSPSPIVDEKESLDDRSSEWQIESTTSGAGKGKKKRKPKKKKPRTISTSSADTAAVVIPTLVDGIRKYEVVESDIPVEEFSCGFHATALSRHRQVMRGYARIIGKSYGCGY